MNMTSMESLLYLAFFLYISSTLGYICHFFSQKESLQKWAALLVIGGVIAHVSSVICHGFSLKALPVFNMLQNLSLAGVILGIVFLACQYFFHLYGLGIFVSTFLTVILGLVLYLPEAPAVSQEYLPTGFWLYSHIALSFAGDAALGLAAGAGILYLIQERGIKNKTPGFFFKRLPPLDYLDEMSSTFLGAGFCLFTFGLVTGAIYAKAVWGRFWGWDIKELFSLSIWLIYAGLLHCRFYAGWRGRKSAVMTIIGFFLVIFTFLGVNLFLGGHHQVFTR